MEESTCHEMFIHLSQRFSSMLCVVFRSFSLVKYDFVDAETMIVKCEKYKEISASMV